MLQKNTKNSDVPFHVGIIMDGNRRWAKKRKMPQFEGHRQGLRTLIKISNYAWKRGVRVLTLYAFSSENWQRAKKEVNYLMKLISLALNEKYLSSLIRNKISLRVIGDKRRLPKYLQEKIRTAEKRTGNGKSGILNLAISYGGRLEIIEAIRKILRKKIKVEKIDENMISNNLWTKGLPDPELIIRTGGEKRLSNFLTWQSIYSELYFTDKYWPDFEEDDLEKAFENYRQREKRFGK